LVCTRDPTAITVEVGVDTDGDAIASDLDAIVVVEEVGGTVLANISFFFGLLKTHRRKKRTV
jgi:hypothetical protein